MVLDSLLRGRATARIRDMALRTFLLARGRPRSYWYVRDPNFGDQLSPVVLEWVIHATPEWVTHRYPGKILAIGSIIGRALAARDIVWGSGLIRDTTVVPPPATTFLAVRGPLTRARIAGDVPEVYGDPALLLPLFHSGSIDKKHRVGIVPHYVDRDALRVEDPAMVVIDVGKHWRYVVDTIRSCEVILSSSLHGLIVAEAYGIPAVWIRITDAVVGDGFKFNDYFLATGRDTSVPMDWERGIREALKRVLPELSFDAQPLFEAGKRIWVHGMSR